MYVRFFEVRVLLSGGAGFIGSHVAEHLLERGHEVAVVEYVEDVARANVLALEGDPPSGSYNIGTGVETSVNRLYELLCGAAGRSLPPRYGPAKPGEQLRSSVNPSRAERVLGWRPEMSLAGGLRETLRFFGAL